MRNPLRKRLLREFKGNLGKYLAIIILLTITITMGSGFLVVSDSMEYTLEQDQETNKLEDGYFTTCYELPEEISKQLEDMNLQIANKQYIDETNVCKDATVRLYENREIMDLASVHEGTLPVKENEIALDRVFAERRELKVGSNVEIEGKTMVVTGLVSLPDYSSLFRSNSDMVMDSIYFGVGLVSKDGFATLNQNRITYNYGYYFNDRSLEKKEKQDIETKMMQLLATTTELQDFLPAQDNQAISFLPEDMGSDVPTMKALIYMLLVIMAFVFATLSRSTIEEEAAIIGTLRASGYRKQELIRHYMSLPLLATAFSAVMGNILGYTIMIGPFKDLYYTTYSAAPFMMRFNLEAFLMTTIVPIIMMLVINYIIIHRMLSLSPLKFLRRDLKRRKQKKARRLPDFKFVTRFRLRVIIQNKGSYLLMFIGIFMASALLMFGLGIMPLINNYVDKADDSIVSDYEYILKAPTPSESGEKITVTNMDTWYEFGNCDIEVVFNGIGENSSYYKDLPLYDQEKGVVLSSDFANKTGFDVGDTITFKDPYTEKSYDLKVAEIYPYVGSLAIFMKQKDLNAMLNQQEDYFNGYLSNTPLQLDEKYIAKTITREDIKGSVEQMAVSFEGIMNIIDFFSILIYLVLIYLMTKLVLDKNTMNISLMKVFGYRQKEVRKLYLNATTVVVVLSLILCIPLEFITVKAVMKYSLDKIGGYIGFFIPWYLYIEIIAVGLLSYIVINSIHIWRVRKISMNLTLKNRE